MRGLEPVEARLLRAIVDARLSEFREMGLDAVFTVGERLQQQGRLRINVAAGQCECGCGQAAEFTVTIEGKSALRIHDMVTR